jgi:hypothetical protein
MSGTAKKSGSAYDMIRLIVEKPQETTATATMKRQGIGKDQQEFEMTQAAFDKLSELGLTPGQFPISCDLVIGHKMGFRGLESIIEEVRPVPVKAAA